MDTHVSVSQAARLKKVTRQAIYLAIKLKRLKAYRHDNSWRIFIRDLNEYDSKLYSTEHRSDHDGSPIFDDANGFFSIEKCSQLTKIPRQKLYYAIRKGWLKAKRKRASYIVFVYDLFKYQSDLINGNLTAKQA